jgi:hypothetical protein
MGQFKELYESILSEDYMDNGKSIANNIDDEVTFNGLFYALEYKIEDEIPKHLGEVNFDVTPTGGKGFTLDGDEYRVGVHLSEVGKQKIQSTLYLYLGSQGSDKVEVASPKFRKTSPVMSVAKRMADMIDYYIQNKME